MYDLDRIARLKDAMLMISPPNHMAHGAKPAIRGVGRGPEGRPRRIRTNMPVELATLRPSAHSLLANL